MERTVFIRELIEKNSIVAVAIVFATGISIGWTISGHMRVKPLEFQFSQSEKVLQNINEVIIPRLVENKIPSPEPAQQCEIVRLYEQLAVAIEKRNTDMITRMYSGNSTFSKTKRQELLSKYKPLMGTKVHYYLSIINHNDDGTVSVYAKAFCADGKLINIKDTLIYEGLNWRILDN